MSADIIHTTGVVGFLFGPVFAALGILLLLVLGFRRFGEEQLTVTPTLLTQRFAWSRFRWGLKEMKVPEVGLMCRLVTNGVHGFSLEVVSEGRMLVVGSGASTRTPLTPDALLHIAREIQTVVRPAPGGEE